MKIFEKYEKLSKIGEGAFGLIYKAQNKNSKELVAIKEVSLIQEGRNIKEDIENEIKFMKIFNYCPNSVKFIESYEENDKTYIVMELCDADIPHFLKSQKMAFQL